MTTKQKLLIGTFIFLLSNGIFLVNHSSIAIPPDPIDELITCDDDMASCVEDCLTNPDYQYNDDFENCMDYCLNECPLPEPSPTPSPTPQNDGIIFLKPYPFLEDYIVFPYIDRNGRYRYLIMPIPGDIN